MARHKDAETVEALMLLYECCLAALSFLKDDSRSPRRRNANIVGLEDAIAKVRPLVGRMIDRSEIQLKGR